MYIVKLKNNDQPKKNPRFIFYCVSRKHAFKLTFFKIKIISTFNTVVIHCTWHITKRMQTITVYNDYSTNQNKCYDVNLKKKNYIIQSCSTKDFIRRLTWGKLSMKLWMLALRAAVIISSIGTSLELSPYAMFSAILVSNSVGSWDTIPIWDRNQVKFSDFRSKFSANFNRQRTKTPYLICTVVIK